MVVSPISRANSCIGDVILVRTCEPISDIGTCSPHSEPPHASLIKQPCGYLYPLLAFMSTCRLPLATSAELLRHDLAFQAFRPCRLCDSGSGYYFNLWAIVFRRAGAISDVLVPVLLQ